MVEGVWVCEVRKGAGDIMGDRAGAGCDTGALPSTQVSMLARSADPTNNRAPTPTSLLCTHLQHLTREGTRHGADACSRESGNKCGVRKGR